KQQPLTANHNTPHAGIHCAILNQHHTAPTPPRAGSRCDGNTGSPGYGGHSGGETPGPIPNPEAKPSSADGTAPARVWESRTPPTTTPPHTTNKGAPTTRGPFCIRSHQHVTPRNPRSEADSPLPLLPQLADKRAGRLKPSRTTSPENSVWPAWP